MSFFRSNKFITFICLLVAALMLTLGITAFMPNPTYAVSTNGIVAAVNVNFDMFKSFSALKVWLSAIPYYIYLSVALVLFLIAVLCIIVAVCKKARYRRNDVSVLILVGDEDEKVDATVFKEHYAVVVVAKPSSLSPIQPRVLPQIIPLENNKRYIPIPNENPQQSVEKEDIITVTTVGEVVQEKSTIEEKPIVEEKPVVVEKPVEKKVVKEQAPIIVTKPIEQAPIIVTKPVEQAPIIVTKPIEEEKIIFEDIEPEQYVEEIYQEPIQPTQTVNMDEVFEQAYSDINTTKLEEEELYDESEFMSENFEEIQFDQNEFNISPIIINSIPELANEEPLSTVANQNDAFECITVQEEIKPKVKESIKKAESSYDVQEFEPIAFMQSYQSDTNEMAFEEESATDSVPLVDMTDINNKNNLLLIAKGTSDRTNTEDAAYAIIKEKDATPQALDAVQNGAIIVDADGDDIADEVLEDKDILKMRYKTVELDKRLKRTEEEVKGYYSDLKNALLAYKGVKSRLSKKFDTFTLGRFIVAKLALRGNVINLYLALPNEQVDDKYFAEDVGDSDTYGKTPTLHKVKSKRGCKYGVELIHDLLNAIAVVKIEDFEVIDYAAMYPADNIEDKKKEIEHLITDRIFVEDIDVLSDEEAAEFIQIVKDKNHTINKFNPINKFVAFIDDIAELYEANETVTIESLVAKGALPDMDNLFLEIRSKGYIDKQLTVEAHSFDIKAVKMITLVGGNIIQYK